MVCTSPPYFGLRDYGVKPSVWGGDPKCRHEWGKTSRGSQRQRNGADGGIHTGRVTNKLASNVTLHPEIGAFCQHCNAWRGAFGLEPNYQLYVDHTVEIFREVHRVLRADGTLFLNLGDSYWSNPAKGGSGTFNGRNGRGEGYARAQRANAYGKRGKAPEDSQASDCFCQSLCDACRAAYQIGRSHTANLLVSMPLASNSASSHEHKESLFDHLPTSGSTRQDDRSEAANPNQQRAPRRAGALPRVSLASTIAGCVRPPSDLRSPASSQGAGCRLCGCSLLDCDQASVHTAACICGTKGVVSVDRMIGRDASDSAYRDYTTASLKPKDLCGIPWRVAFALQNDGWYLRQDIIWSKGNPMPESVTDRCTKSHEYLFMLSKSEKYYFDQDAIREPFTDASIERLRQDIANQKGSDRVPGKTNGPMKAVARHLPGNKTHRGKDLYDAGDERHRTKAGLVDYAERQRALNAGRSSYRSGSSSSMEGTKHHQKSDAGLPLNEMGRNKRSVWTVTTESFSEAHFATMPPALVEPCIEAGTSEKGACAACGRPWKRTFECITPKNEYRYKAIGIPGEGEQRGRRDEVGNAQYAAVGWEADCGCEESVVPCVVLDPFGGAGTVGVVCDRLKNRSAILIDLNPAYVEMAGRRLKRDAQIKPRGFFGIRSGKRA